MMDLKLLDYIDSEYCVAIIPARGGSKSVPKKNIRLVYNHPLIAYSIAAGRLSHEIQRVIVSTDSSEIAEISLKYGAEVPFMRPDEYARDDSPDIDVFKHAITWFYENESRIPKYIVHLRPTNPLRNPSEIDKAILQFFNDKDATSLRAASVCVNPPYKTFKLENGYFSPVMPGMTCDEANMPRQSYPVSYVTNGYVDVLKTDFIIKNDLMHGDRMVGYITEEIPEIDTEMELKGIPLYDNMNESLKILLNYLNSQVEAGGKL